MVSSVSVSADQPVSRTSWDDRSGRLAGWSVGRRENRLHRRRIGVAGRHSAGALGHLATDQAVRMTLRATEQRFWRRAAHPGLRRSSASAPASPRGLKAPLAAVLASRPQARRQPPHPDRPRPRRRAMTRRPLFAAPKPTHRNDLPLRAGEQHAGTAGRPRDPAQRASGAAAGTDRGVTSDADEIRYIDQAVASGVPLRLQATLSPTRFAC